MIRLRPETLEALQSAAQSEDMSVDALASDLIDYLIRPGAVRTNVVMHGHLVRLMRPARDGYLAWPDLYHTQLFGRTASSTCMRMNFDSSVLCKGSPELGSVKKAGPRQVYFVKGTSVMARLHTLGLDADANELEKALAALK